MHRRNVEENWNNKARAATMSTKSSLFDKHNYTKWTRKVLVKVKQKWRKNLEPVTLQPLNHSAAQLINIEKARSGTELLKAKTIPLITRTKPVYAVTHQHSHVQFQSQYNPQLLCTPPNNLLPKIKPVVYCTVFFALPWVQDPINLKQGDDPWLIHFMFYIPVSIKLHRSNENAVHEGNSNVVIH